jgi:hypothetical protein
MIPYGKKLQERADWSPKKIAAEFKLVMEEAITFYEKPGHVINQHQFHFISKSRVGRSLISKIGGYSIVKNYFYPSPNQKLDVDSLKLLRKLLK